MVGALVVGALEETGMATDGERLTDDELALLTAGIRWGEKPDWAQVLSALDELAELREIVREAQTIADNAHAAVTPEAMEATHNHQCDKLAWFLVNKMHNNAWRED